VLYQLSYTRKPACTLGDWSTACQGFFGVLNASPCPCPIRWIEFARTTTTGGGLMKKLLPILFLSGLALLTPSPALAQDRAPVKIACVGDSITQGVGAKGDQSYPAQLAALLGDRFVVRNFGNSGSTLLQNGDKPYQKQTQYAQMLEMKADAYVIKLGTNDSKPHNWVKKDQFKPSASALIDAIREANPKAVIFLCLPVPAFPANFGITDEVIRTEVIPLLKEVAAEKQTKTIDLYAVLEGKKEMVPDKVHPNAEGYKLISAAVHKALVEQFKP
jgi:acyl-CoA thioesterase-1